MNRKLNLTVPKSWADLRQCQLRELYHAMATVNILGPGNGQQTTDNGQWAQVAMICILKWNRLKMVTPYADGYLFRQRKTKNGQRKTTQEYYLTKLQLTDLAYTMEWIREPPAMPLCLRHVGGAEALPADLSEGITFEAWLACENYWQGYQATLDEAILREMAAILYRKEDIVLASHESISVFYWWLSVKRFVSAKFPHFFRPASGGQQSPLEVERSMNAQIRALTKGDITKEEKILSMDAMRALTELDALAREYEELNRKYPKKS